MPSKLSGEDLVTTEAKKFGGVPSFTEVPLLAATFQAKAEPRHLIYRFNNGEAALRFRTEFNLSSKVRTRKIKGRSGFLSVLRIRSLRNSPGAYCRHGHSTGSPCKAAGRYQVNPKRSLPNAGLDHWLVGVDCNVKPPLA